MQLRYVFSELGQGLRRNLSMHVAVILTLFVSLTLVGLGVLLNQQATRPPTSGAASSRSPSLLCKAGDDNPACTGEVTDAAEAAIAEVVEDNPEVADYHNESKEEAFEKVKELLGPSASRAPTPRRRPRTCRSRCGSRSKDPDEYEGITSAVVGLDGVSGVRDMRDGARADLREHRRAAVGRARGRAAFLVARRAAAGRQHDPAGRARPTARDRHHAAGRRLHALHRAAVPPGGAGDRLHRRRAGGRRAGARSCTSASSSGLRRPLGFMPWIGMADTSTPWLRDRHPRPVLTLLPTLVLTRKYLKV